MRAPLLGQCPCESKAMSLRFEMKCDSILGGGLCSCADPKRNSLIVPGSRKEVYDSIVHVFGQAEVQPYFGGSTGLFGNPPWMVINGAPQDGSTFNSYWISFESVQPNLKAWLNNDFGQPNPIFAGYKYFTVDYLAKMRFRGGSCVTLNARSNDNKQIRNFYAQPDCAQNPLICEKRPAAEPISPSGVFIGQWLQVDFGEFISP